MADKLYLLDANVLITAHNKYYPVDRVPEYWDWLRYHGEQGRVKIPIEIIEEIDPKPRTDDRLRDWLLETENLASMKLDDEVREELVSEVVSNGYASDLTNLEHRGLGADPFLIAYAYKNREVRSIVTLEVSQPKRKRQNRKVPDVCKTLDIKCHDPFQLNELLDFSTNWRGRIDV